MSATVEIDGRVWRIVDPTARVSALRPLEGDPEGGTLVHGRGGWRRTLLPDGVTTARQRTNVAMKPRTPGGNWAAKVGACNVWLISPLGIVVAPLLSSNVTRKAPHQLAVLRVLAEHPGRWVCNRKLHDAAGWRFSEHVRKLRKKGYPIQSQRCAHTHHDTPVGAYRLPGLGGNE